jgi:hypothetical protein
LHNQYPKRLSVLRAAAVVAIATAAVAVQAAEGIRPVLSGKWSVDVMHA